MVTEQNILQLLLTIIMSYLVGSLPTAYLIAKTRNINIFESGSGNMGGTNIARSMGVVWGVITIVLDALKGVLAVIVGQLIMGDKMWSSTTITVASISAVVGHNWSLFASLIYTSATRSSRLIIRGGKGGATAFGTLLMFAPYYVIVGMMAFGFVLFLKTRYVSLGVLSGFMVALPWVVVLVAQNILPAAYIVYAVAVALLIIWRFRENIDRIVKGTERRLGEPV